MIVITFFSLCQVVNRAKFDQIVDDREWSNMVLREVIMEEICERYGRNAELKDQLL